MVAITLLYGTFSIVDTTFHVKSNSPLTNIVAPLPYVLLVVFLFDSCMSVDDKDRSLTLQTRKNIVGGESSVD